MLKLIPTLFTLVRVFGAAGLASELDTSKQERKRMTDQIREISREDRGRYVISERVLEAMEKVQRHEFVPERYRRRAYHDTPLPIGEGQTISQPYIVALMTELAKVNNDSVVLEIGTGSGYQAAVLGELADRVYTIEIVSSLGKRAAKTLDRLGYKNTTVRIGDGYAGWPERAPFDAILVTAAPETIPRPLIEQLKVGGRLVIPVGPQGLVQTLRVLTKQENGEIVSEDITSVLFVPFTREK